MKSREEEVQEFVESLYNDMDEQLNDTYRQKKESRDELLKAIAMIMLTCNIVDSVLKLSKGDEIRHDKLLKNLILSLTRGDIKQITHNTTNILKNTVNKTYDFYSYNHNLKDVEKIINQNFKGKHFSSRVWENEHEVAKKLTKQCQDFLQGKINVNQIEKEIKDTYNTSAYNAKRLVDTEVSRVHNQSFDKLAKETGVKKVKREEVLDGRTCKECAEHDGDIWDFDNPNKPTLPEHPCCRGYWSIVE